MTEGLSPRVRGNRDGARRRPRERGSIPACAGEPRLGGGLVKELEVYPRVCGGTGPMWRPAASGTGLSPRVRGNLPPRTQWTTTCGSIPACAGEPSASLAQRRLRRVYPRVCGGTLSLLFSALLCRGLSPRVRGNRSRARRRRVRAGSIPACAGEPPAAGRGAERGGVYPRVCGGTHQGPSTIPMRRGLSPRVRGNHVHRAHAEPVIGSIPACAGEPSRVPHGSRVGRVYPRVCGGTSAFFLRSPGKSGLSPRVRGNHAFSKAASASPGSIPACAGEPRRR